MTINVKSYLSLVFIHTNTTIIQIVRSYCWSWKCKFIALYFGLTRGGTCFVVVEKTTNFPISCDCCSFLVIYLYSYIFACKKAFFLYFFHFVFVVVSASVLYARSAWTVFPCLRLGWIIPWIQRGFLWL